jgi:acetyl esterase/lipase
VVDLRRALVGAAVLAAALPVACGGDESIVSIRDLLYVDTHVLDVHAPIGGDGLPVVVVLHGAGLQRDDYEPFAVRLAESGAVVFNVEWDVLPRGSEAALEQIACAVRVARALAPDHGGDTARLVLVGHSSASPWATRSALVGEEYHGACAAEETALPDALALLAPSSVPGGWPWEHSLLGRRPELDVTVVHGIDDDLARTSFGRRTAQLLSDAGHDVTFEIVPGGHFDLVMIPAGASGEIAPDVDAADRTIEAILALVDDPAR